MLVANTQPMMIQYRLPIPFQHYNYVCCFRTSSPYQSNNGCQNSSFFTVNTNLVLHVKIGQMLGKRRETNMRTYVYIFSKCWRNLDADMFVAYTQPKLTANTDSTLYVVSKHHPNISPTIFANIVLMFAVNSNPMYYVSRFKKCWANFGKQMFIKTYIANVGQCWVPICQQQTLNQC